MTEATTRNPQLLKGVLPMLILALVAGEESYGYGLVTRLREAGLSDIAPGTVYPVLNRLEREGQLESRLLASSSGPARKYYRLTEQGRASRVVAQQGWQRLSEVARSVLADVAPDALESP